MRARLRLRIGTGLAVALLVAPAARADERGIVVTMPGSALDDLEAACATPTPECEARINGRLAAGLLYLAEMKAPEVYPLARLAADVDSVTVRVAAAEALGSIAAKVEDTPILAELLDDPVPAVRDAALRSLRSSGDERGRLFAARADRFSAPAETDLDPEAPQAWPALAAMGVPMPADAIFLHFASDRAEGRYVWVTSEPAAKVIGRLSGAGRGALTPAAYRQQIATAEAAADAKAARIDAAREARGDSEIPSEEEMEEALAMAEKVMAAMDELEGKGPEEQAAVLQRVAGAQDPLDAQLADAYEKSELFGDPRLVVVPMEDVQDMVVAVYSDLLLGGTGITVHRVPLARE